MKLEIFYENEYTHDMLWLASVLVSHLDVDFILLDISKQISLVSRILVCY